MTKQLAALVTLVVLARPVKVQAIEQRRDATTRSMPRRRADRPIR